MDPEKEALLDETLVRMRFEVEPEPFALVAFAAPPLPADLELVAGDGPVQVLREGGETTLLIPAAHLAAVLGRHPGSRVEGDLRWIRFTAPMGWELVGFLARVTGLLAEAGVPLGAISGFSRDHLFVAARHLDRARGALAELFAEP